MTTTSSIPERRKRVAELAAARGYNGIVVSTPAGFSYLTGIDPRAFVSTPVARLSSDGELTVLASSADEAALAELPAHTGLSLWEHRRGTPSALRALEGAWQEDLAAEGRAFRGIAAASAAADGASILADATRTKFDDEIEFLREAANLADIAYTATVDRLHPELRAYEIARNVDRSIRAAGGGGWWSLSESDDDLGSTAVFPAAGIVGLLDRIPETGVLDTAEPLAFQLHPLSHTHTGASGTTVVFRRPESEIRDTAHRLGAGLNAALSVLAPGASTAEAASRFAAELGDVAADLVGFSVGTGPGEVVIADGVVSVPEPRSVLTLRATARGSQGRPGVTFQTTVLVPEAAAERLDVVVQLRLIELY